MRIGIFVTMAGCQAGGTETYERRLVESMASLGKRDEFHIFCLSRQAAGCFENLGPQVHRHVLWPPMRWVSIPVCLPLRLLQHRIDLCHATFVPPPFSPVDYAITMHCFSTFIEANWYPPAILRRLNHLIVTGIRKAKLIICVSEHVRDLTAERFGIPQERLAVVYHGVSDHFQPMNADTVRVILQQRFGLSNRYVLFVGKLEQRKNIVRILEAFNRFRIETAEEVKLVLAGRRTWDAALVDQTLDRLGVRQHVVEVGHIDQSDLPALYCGAEMLLFPSLWEGFGIPVIEAMACGTPVITSTVSSLPEVAGDAAFMVNPESIDDITAGMLKVFTDDVLRQTLRKKGLIRASSFTWERTAKQTMLAYARAAAN